LIKLKIILQGQISIGSATAQEVDEALRRRRVQSPQRQFLPSLPRPFPSQDSPVDIYVAHAHRKRDEVPLETSVKVLDEGLGFGEYRTASHLITESVEHSFKFQCDALLRHVSGGALRLSLAGQVRILIKPFDWSAFHGHAWIFEPEP
jgi:hypothetical protein